MAYIPSPIKFDAFISYAHEDADWVESFSEQLTERLLHRLGYPCEVWQDVDQIRTGQNWPDELSDAISASAAFITILSRNYQKSDYCGRELDHFLAPSEAQHNWKTGGYGRVLKVVKFPWLLDAHEGFLADYQHVAFFDRDPKTGRENEYKQTSASFRKAVDILSFHIEKLFEAMLRSRVNVFVARTATDASDERASLIREIRAAGFALSPPPLGDVPKALDRKTLKNYVAAASASVHVIGAQGDDTLRQQIDLALESEKRVIFYFTQQHGASGHGEHSKLIDEIRENKWGLPEGSWSLLESRSAMRQRQDLISLLAPPTPSVSSSTAQTARVYLLCDSTSPEDASFAREMQGKIRDKEGFQVEMPQPSATLSTRSEEHERLLGECDGLLLYRNNAPEKWYRRNFVDVLMADDRQRTRELKSRALLLTSSDLTHPDLTVIRRRDPFELDQLEQFLAPLRGVGPRSLGAVR